MKRLICVALALALVSCMAVDVSAADRNRDRAQDGVCENDGPIRARVQDQTCPDGPCGDPACGGDCPQDCEPQRAQERLGWFDAIVAAIGGWDPFNLRHNFGGDR